MRSDDNSDTDSVQSDGGGGGHNSNGPLLVGPSKRKSARKSARFNLLPPDSTSSTSSSSQLKRSSSSSGRRRDDDDEAYVEITLDIHDDSSIAVHSVVQQAAGKGRQEEDPELALLAKKTLEKKSSFGSSLFRTTSFTIKQVSQELKRLASLSRPPPPPTSRRLDRTKSAVTHALKGLKFITAKTPAAASWPAVEKRFDDLTASTDALLHSSLFSECIGMKDSKEFAGELFRALARRHNITGDSIDKTQLKAFWEQISDQGFDSRLQTFFDMVDKNADGRITEEEVTEIISLSAAANNLTSIQKQANEYAALIVEELDPDNVGYIMVEKLEMLLLQAPNQSVGVGDSRILSQMLSQKLKGSQEKNPLRRWYQKGKYWVMDNWQRLWVLLLWLGIVAALFAYKFLQYRHKAAVFEVMGYCVCTAKAAAETLKLNMALILLPVCRNTITWLRNKTKLGLALPFDDNLNFHKLIAVAIAVGVGLHAGAHLACDFPRLLHATEEQYEPLEPYFGEEQPSNYGWFLKGVEGVTGIVMVVLMAIAFTLAAPWFRRNKLNLPVTLKKLTGFNAFWYSHHLFVIVYALLIVHGIYLYLTKEWYKKTTWMYIAVPAGLYACERLIRAFRSTVKPVKIQKVAVYPGNVLTLQMTKPQGFKYRSGQYMFVNCSAVSPFEWHPFSITSAPGDDYVSVHIRTLGDWTRQLKTVFSEVCQPPTGGKSGLLRADCSGLDNHGDAGPNFPKILIDGPYGAPAQDYKKYEVVLLVGLGIGATPMISIVKDIISNIKAKDEDAVGREGGSPGEGEGEGDGDGDGDGCSSSSSRRKGKGERGKRKKSKGHNNFKTKRAYYYWVTREQGSFEWFKGIMNEVGEMDEEGVIELHNYCTSVFEEGDARSALITMLQSLHHAKNGIDVVSGTRVKSHFAKPNWRQVFKKIAIHHPHSRIGVFYCGAPALTKDLQQLAWDFSHKTTTKFDFHKENF